QTSFPVSASMAKILSELPPTMTYSLMPWGIFTPSTTIGAVSEVNSLGALSSRSFHFTSSVPTLLRFRIVSWAAHPVRCESPPKVGQSHKPDDGDANRIAKAARAVLIVPPDPPYRPAVSALRRLSRPILRLA